MNEDLKDILSNLNPEIDQEILMRYLQGQLSAAEQHELEKQMLQNDFDSDAMEGLDQFTNKKDLTHLVDQLNKDLKEKTEKKKKFRRRLELKIEPWLLITIILVLLLTVISFLVIHRYIHH
ncbi:MAG TPA: hypothetical protein VHK91_13960 [Flavisolibacter sp.]|jgi:hypothetical protein|nr:hypothetical protein [Flavisolibacter sp.]